MNTASEPAGAQAREATLAAAVFAVDPHGVGGIVLRARCGPARDHWLVLVRALLRADEPWRRIPPNVTDDRLLGGLDLVATLRSRRPVAQRGLMAEAHGGVIILPMAERTAPTAAARIGAALDRGVLTAEREGLSLDSPARFGVIALDEGIDSDEQPPPGLMDRLGIHLILQVDVEREISGSHFDLQDISAARERLCTVSVDADGIEALTAAAAALGIDSLRAPLLALRVARAAAALAERDAVSREDLALAARLVLAPRARAIASTSEREEQPQTPQEQAGQAAEAAEERPQTLDDRPLQDRVLAAAQAAIPQDLLLRLRSESGGGHARQTSGRSRQHQRSLLRGRPLGVRPGDPRRGARLSIVGTLRAAAAWQGVRARERAGAGATAHRSKALEVRAEDFRVQYYRQRNRNTTIFAVDASGSTALHRLAEAKGAVELLLAQCYLRRDRVALLAFRGQRAEVLLPPTRSLVRAKRCLAELPGGGGTPLASAIDAAVAMAMAVRQQGETPIVVFLTDGRANVARDGTPGRAAAEADALQSARAARAVSLAAFFIDTSPRSQPAGQLIAHQMHARYLALPRADARQISQAVRMPTARG